MEEKYVWKDGRLIEAGTGDGLVGTVFQQTPEVPEVPAVNGLGNIDVTKYMNSKNNGLGTDFNLKNIGAITDIATGLGGIYLGNKQLGLAEDKFAFDKDMMNKQYAMAKDAYDKQVARAKNIGDQMNAGKVV